MSYIGNQPTNVAFLTDTFSGNGSTTAFTMTVAPANTSSILVAITGVVQDPSTYSVSGTTLTFSAAPPSGTSNISVRYLGIPASGVTTTAYRTVTNFTATAGQTSFSVPSYTVGYIDVYRNGVRLVSTDYTASTGTTVVLAAGCNAGDAVVTESFYVSSVLNAIPATAGAVNSTYLASSLSLTSPTLSNPTFTGTASGTVLVSGTKQATTSGTNIDFTGIPSWVKRITLMFQGVSSNGSSRWVVRLGTAGGVAATGYLGAGAYAGGTNICGGENNTTGFAILNGGAAQIMHGAMTLSLLDSSTNTWVASGTFGDSSQAYCFFSGGSTALSGACTTVRLTTANGTDAFDAGSVNIIYE